MCSEAVVSKASSTAVIFHIYILLFFTTFPKRELLKTPLKRKKRERERLGFFKTVSFSFFFFFFFLRVERKSRPLLQTDADAPLKDWRADRNRQEPFFFSLSQSGQKKKKKKWGLGTSVWCKKIISVCPATLSQRLCPLCLLVAFYFSSSSSRFVNCV